MWLMVGLAVLFMDRNNFIHVIIVISILLILTAITILRAINSRNEWRKMIEDGEVEIKDKISFD
tara:strand:- start:391 stop:582 length:192 start_codon:yes stop_codon:yes gene_type:complete